MVPRYSYFVNKILDSGIITDSWLIGTINIYIQPASAVGTMVLRLKPTGVDGLNPVGYILAHHRVDSFLGLLTPFGCTIDIF